MGFENDKFNPMSDSIFSSKTESYPTVPISPEKIPTPESLQGGSFVGYIVDKLTNKKDNYDGNDKNGSISFTEQQKQIEAIIEENKEVFEIFAKYNCNMTMAEDGIIVEYPNLGMKGKMTIKEDGTSEFDEDAMNIFKHLAKLVVCSDNLNSDIDKHESEKFYPIGDLVSDKVTYKGKEIEVMVGMMVNPEGKTKKVYFYHGKEILPDS